MDLVEFNPTDQTNRLQDAVPRNDRPLLERLLSDRFAFVSRRALGRLGKKAWITAAVQDDWEQFAVTTAGVVELGNVVVVDHDIEQEMRGSPVRSVTLGRTAYAAATLAIGWALGIPDSATR